MCLQPGKNEKSKLNSFKVKIAIFHMYKVHFKLSVVQVEKV